MDKKLKKLASILRVAGHDEEAKAVESFKLKIDPLSAAVSMGFLNPDVLTVFEEEGHEEDLSEFKELIDRIKESEIT